MPLEKGSSKEAIAHNIKTEQNAGKPHDQAVAIALHTADESKNMDIEIKLMDTGCKSWDEAMTKGMSLNEFTKALKGSSDRRVPISSVSPDKHHFYYLSRTGQKIKLEGGAEEAREILQSGGRVFGRKISSGKPTSSKPEQKPTVSKPEQKPTVSKPEQKPTVSKPAQKPTVSKPANPSAGTKKPPIMGQSGVNLAYAVSRVLAGSGGKKSMDVSDVNKTANPASHPHRVSCGEAASLLHTIAFEKAFGDMHRQKCMECAKSLGSILTESQPDYDSKDKDNSGEPEAKESDGFPKGVNEETGEAPTSYNDRQDAEGDKDRAKAKEDEGQERMAGSIGKKDVKGLKNDTDLQTRQIEALTKSLDKLVSVL